MNFSAFGKSNTATSQLLPVLLRNSHRRFYVRKGVLRNFGKFRGKHLCHSLFFNKVAGLSLQLY